MKQKGGEQQNNNETIFYRKIDSSRFKRQCCWKCPGSLHGCCRGVDLAQGWNKVGEIGNEDISAMAAVTLNSSFLPEKTDDDITKLRRTGKGLNLCKIGLVSGCSLIAWSASLMGKFLWGSQDCKESHRRNSKWASWRTATPEPFLAYFRARNCDQYGRICDLIFLFCD